MTIDQLLETEIWQELIRAIKRYKIDVGSILDEFMKGRDMKYEMVENFKISDGKFFQQIKAIRNIPMHKIRSGDLGGWIDTNSTLTQKGDCWVMEGAEIINTFVEGDALVSSKSIVINSDLSGFLITKPDTIIMNKMMHA